MHPTRMERAESGVEVDVFDCPACGQIVEAPRFVVHEAGPIGIDGKQRCRLCDAELTDMRFEQWHGPFAEGARVVVTATFEMTDLRNEPTCTKGDR